MLTPLAPGSQDAGFDISVRAPAERMWTWVGLWVEGRRRVRVCGESAGAPGPGLDATAGRRPPGGRDRRSPDVARVHRAAAGSTSVDGPPCPTPCVGVAGVPGPALLRESTRDLGKGTWAGAGRGMCTGPPLCGHCCQPAARGRSRPRPGRGPHGAAAPGEVRDLAVLEPPAAGGAHPHHVLRARRGQCGPCAAVPWLPQTWALPPVGLPPPSPAGPQSGWVRGVQAGSLTSEEQGE